MEKARQAIARRRDRFAPPVATLRELYDRLLRAYGRQAWWPAETPFEVVVGAVLTQNAAWSNVEKAIENLRSAGLLALAAINAVAQDELAEAIRPSGYFNIKAQRLRNLCRFLADAGGLEAFAERPLGEQRAALLAVNGVGPETADDILLYALGRPVFVIDAYTRRLLQRLELAQGHEAYEALRSGFERTLGADVDLFQQYHALIVMHAKAACRKRPQCTACMLREACPTGRQTP